MKRVEPVLPANKQATKAAKVKLHIVISPAGDVSSADLVSGDSALAEAAVSAVKQWKYKPFMENGEPIPVETDVELGFSKRH